MAYCSNACRQAAYRERRAREAAERWFAAANALFAFYERGECTFSEFVKACNKISGVSSRNKPSSASRNTQAA